MTKVENPEMNQDNMLDLWRYLQSFLILAKFSMQASNYWYVSRFDTCRWILRYLWFVLLSWELHGLYLFDGCTVEFITFRKDHLHVQLHNALQTYLNLHTSKWALTSPSMISLHTQLKQSNVIAQIWNLVESKHFAISEVFKILVL